MDNAKQEELELSWEVEKALDEMIKTNSWNHLPNDMAIFAEEISDWIANKLYKNGYRKKNLVDGL